MKTKTKKVPAKTSAAKKTTKPTISEAQLTAILNRLEAGKSGLIAEATALGFNGSKPLHSLLTKHLGGKVKYDAMLARAIKARSGKKVTAKKAPVKKVTVKKVPKANGEKETKANGEKEEIQPLKAVA